MQKALLNLSTDQIRRINQTEKPKKQIKNIAARLSKVRKLPSWETIPMGSSAMNLYALLLLATLSLIAPKV